MIYNAWLASDSKLAHGRHKAWTDPTKKKKVRAAADTWDDPDRAWHRDWTAVFQPGDDG